MSIELLDLAGSGSSGIEFHSLGAATANALSIYSYFDKGCPTHKRLKAYATMPIGIIGSKR